MANWSLSSIINFEFKKMKKSIYVGRQISRHEQKHVVGGNVVCIPCPGGNTLCAGGRTTNCNQTWNDAVGWYTVDCWTSSGNLIINSCPMM